MTNIEAPPTSTTEAPQQKTAEQIKTERTKEKREEKLKEIKKNREKADQDKRKETTETVVSNEVEQAAQTSGADEILKNFGDGIFPDDATTAEAVSKIIEKIDQESLQTALDQYGISRDVLDTRINRIKGQLAKDANYSDIDIQAMVVGEILEERGLKTSDRLEIAKADGLEEQEANKQVRAEIEDQRKAEVKNRVKVEFDKKDSSYKTSREVLLKGAEELIREDGSIPETESVEGLQAFKEAEAEIRKVWAELAGDELNAEILATIPITETGIKAMFSKTNAKGDVTFDQVAYDGFVAGIKEELDLKEKELFQVNDGLADGIDAERFREAVIGAELSDEQFDQLLQGDQALKAKIKVAGEINGSEDELALALADLGIDIKEFYEGENGEIKDFEGWEKASLENRQALIANHLRLNLETSIASKLFKKSDVEQPELKAVESVEAEKEKFPRSVEGVVKELDNHPIDALKAVLELRKLNRKGMVREIARKVSSGDINAEIEKLNERLAAIPLITQRKDELNEAFAIRLSESEKLSERRILQAQLTLLEDAQALQKRKGSDVTTEEGYNLQDKLNQYGKKLAKSLDALDKLQAKGSPNTANLIRDILINGVSKESQDLVAEIKKKLTGKALGLLLLILLALLGPIAKEFFNFK